MNVENLNIVVFAYKRPEHLAQCLKSLKENNNISKANLIVCVDGLKPSEIESEKELHQQTIAVAKNATDFLTNTVLVNEANMGLGRQYLSKIDLFLTKYEHLVIIEDDIVVGNNFLQFMTDAFNRFGDKEGISMIVGYTYYIKAFKKNNGSYFAGGSGNKAFGITRKFWSNIDKECHGYEQLKWDKKLRNEYNKFNTKQAGLLIDEIENKRNNSWDAIVYWNSFSKKLLSLSPDYTLAIDTGWNSIGASNTMGDNLYDPKVFDKTYSIKFFPDEVRADAEKEKQMLFYFKYIVRVRFFRKKWKAIIKKFIKGNA